LGTKRKKKPVVEIEDEIDEKCETIFVSQLVKEYIETTKRQKELRERTIQEYSQSLDLMIEITGDSPISQLSQKTREVI